MKPDISSPQIVDDKALADVTGAMLLPAVQAARESARRDASTQQSEPEADTNRYDPYKTFKFR